MADTRLYKVAITPCGKYVHGKEYDTLCLVLNATENGGDGCAYVSLKKNVNVCPGTDDTVWRICLEKGERGEQGPSGAGFSDVSVSVDGTSGTPSGTAVIANDTLYLSLSGIKGAPGEIDEQQLQNIENQISAKQDALVSGSNIKTVGGQNILGSGNIQVGDENAVKFVQQTLSADQKSQARTNIGAQETLVSGSTIKTINSQSILGSGDIPVQGGQDGEDGVGFESITTPSTADGTTLITLTNGDTITLDLNHKHPQYPKYVYCATQAAYDAITTKESDTLYLILESN